MTQKELVERLQTEVAKLNERLAELREDIFDETERHRVVREEREVTGRQLISIIESYANQEAIRQTIKAIDAIAPPGDNLKQEVTNTMKRIEPGILAMLARIEVEESFQSPIDDNRE